MRAASNALLAVLAIAAAVICEVGAPEVVQVPAAALLVFVLPGLALSRALLPRLKGAEIGLVSVALSISVAALGGLVLHLTPSGLTQGSWAVLLAVVTVVAVLVGQVRAADRGGDVERSRVEVSLISVVLLALALVVGAGAMIQARTPLSAKGIEGYTALWVQPRNGVPPHVDLGVQSSELDATRYRLDVFVGKTHVRPYRFALTTGEGWTASVRIRRGWGGTVRALLFRQSEPDRVYRRVRLLVEARGAVKRGRGWGGTVRALLFRQSEPDRVYRRVRLLVEARGAVKRV